MYSSSIQPDFIRYFGEYHLENRARFIALWHIIPGMSLEETVDYLAEEFNLERSEHVEAAGRAVADLQD